MTSVLFRLAVLGIAAVIVLLLAREVTRNDVVVTVFAVSQPLQNKGLTPEMVTRWFADGILGAQTAAQSRVRTQTPVTFFEGRPKDVTIASTGVSVQTVIENVRYCLGRWTVASGELVLVGQELQLTTRVGGRRAAEVRRVMASPLVGDVKALMNEGAVKTLEVLSPYLAAVYYYNRGTAFDADAERTICTLLERSDRKEQAEGLNLWGLLALRQRRYQSAHERFARASELAPHFALAMNNDGLAAEAQGHTQAALERYRRAVELDARSAVTRANYGAALCVTGRCDQGLLFLRGAARAEPLNATVTIKLARALASAGQKAEARTVLTNASMAHPRDARVYVELGRLHQSIAEGRLFSGARLRDPSDYRLVDESLENAERAYSRRAALVAGGRWDTEVDDGGVTDRWKMELDLGNVAYDRALSWLEPRCSAAEADRLFEQAQAAYRRAIEASPLAALAHRNLGQVYLGRAKLRDSRSSRCTLALTETQDSAFLERAIESLLAAVRLDPDDRAHCALAEAYQVAGDAANAAAANGRCAAIH